jgi:outer membrane biosynthesis protein TonB
MSQDGAPLPCRTGLSPGLAPRALFPVAVPFAASLVAHAAVVAALPGRAAAPVVSAEAPAEWVEAPEPVNMEPPAPAEAEEGSPPAAQTREPAAHPASDAPPALVNLPPPDATPGAHAGAPLDDKARAAWFAAARNVVDSGYRYDAIRAQIAGWNPKLVTGTYTPGGRGVAHPDEMPSRRVPAAVVTSVIQANMNRFRVCHGAGLPQSATISGQVLVAFVIEPDGHVSGARDAGGMALPDDAVRQCVVRAVAQLSFPKPPYGVAQEVTIPVVLQAEEALARPDTRGTSSAQP